MPIVSSPNFLKLADIFRDWMLTLKELWVILNTPLSYIVEPLVVSFPPFVVLGGALQLMGLYDATLLEFMLGAGLAIYIGYQLCIWLLNLFT